MQLSNIWSSVGKKEMLCSNFQDEKGPPSIFSGHQNMYSFKQISVWFASSTVRQSEATASGDRGWNGSWGHCLYSVCPFTGCVCVCQLLLAYSHGQGTTAVFSAVPRTVSRDGHETNYELKNPDELGWFVVRFVSHFRHPVFQKHNETPTLFPFVSPPFASTKEVAWLPLPIVPITSADLLLAPPLLPL